MRRDRWVASMALTATLALVAVPGSAWSHSPAGDPAVAPDQFQAVVLDQAAPGSATTTDPALRSASALLEDSVLREPAPGQSALPSRALVSQPAPQPGAIDLNPWRFDPNISWYGPGFYGQATACGEIVTFALVGVAHRTLPCGTMVTFRNPANGRIVTAPVVDRGPYVSGRQWDMTYGLCHALGHCYTGTIYWKYSF